jgi:hypothetical protein
MTAVGNALPLSQKCAGCHVGSQPAPGFRGVRDVNHDLIAAGHPRLNFEYAAFLANLPPHWKAEKRTWTPEARARTWAVGQAVTAKAALELLAHRVEQAQRSPPVAPWPEFAEYDCFACHHDLRPKSWRQEPAFAQQRLGSLPWSAWYYAMPRILAESGAADVPELVSALDDLGRLLRLPNPNGDLVITRARKAIGEIKDRLLPNAIRRHYEARSLAKAFRRRLEKPELAAAEVNWDAAAQLYLALAALTDDGKQDAKLEPVIRDLSRILAFPEGQKPAEKYESPKDFQPKLLRTVLQRLDP